MKIQAILHEGEQGGYWAEVPSLRGCYTQGDTVEEIIENLRDVIELFLSLDVQPAEPGERAKLREIVV